MGGPGFEFGERTVVCLRVRACVCVFDFLRFSTRGKRHLTSERQNTAVCYFDLRHPRIAVLRSMNVSTLSCH